MNADEIIDSYVDDVVRLLPRRQRSGIARMLRATLHDELGDRGGVEPTAAEALALVRRYGLPSDVAARYRAPVAVIDSTAARWLIPAGWIGTAVIAAGGLVDAVTQPGFSERPLQSASAYWTGTLLLTFCWLGLLAASAMAATAARRRRPAKPWTPPNRHRVGSDNVNRWAYGAAIAGMTAGIVALSDPQLLMRTVTSAAAQPQVLAAFAYDPTFASRRLPALVGVLALNTLLYVIVAVQGGWGPLTRRADIVHGLALVGAMLWALLGGDVYQATETDQIMKLALAIFIVVSLVVTANKIRRERLGMSLTPRPEPGIR